MEFNISHIQNLVQPCVVAKAAISEHRCGTTDLQPLQVPCIVMQKAFATPSTPSAIALGFERHCPDLTWHGLPVL